MKQTDEDWLYFLEQYTVGEPRELVWSCFNMEATNGYDKRSIFLNTTLAMTSK